MSNTDEDFMADQEETHTKPAGFFVTVREIHQAVMRIDEKLDSEVNKLKTDISGIKAQLAALYVVQGIMVATIIYLIQKGIG